MELPVLNSDPGVDDDGNARAVLAVEKPKPPVLLALSQTMTTTKMTRRRRRRKETRMRSCL